MKILINIIRFIIAIYVGFLAIVYMMSLADKSNGKAYSTIRGYSYYYVDSNKYEPDIPKKTLLILKSEESQYTVTEGDYVLFVKGDSVVLKKVMKLNASDTALDEYLVGYPNEEESYYTTVKKSDVLFKSIYFSDWLSICYQIFTNWIVVLILVIFLVLSPSLTYKRFEL
jgi:hypothetical protein